jgi:hypothetical protein
MDADVERMLDGFGVDHSGEPADLIDRLCAAVPNLVAVSGAGASVIGPTGSSVLLAASDETARRLYGLELMLGEGPGLEAFATDSSVLVPDLAATERWINYSVGAEAEGVAAVFAFALHLGAIRVGAMTLHRRRSGPLPRDRLRRAFLIADAMTRLTLMIAEGPNEPGRPPGKFTVGVDDDWTAVHQASGMLTVQLGVSIEVALARLRAYAFATGRLTDDVARDIVNRRLRLVDDAKGGNE